MDLSHQRSIPLVRAAHIASNEVSVYWYPSKEILGKSFDHIADQLTDIFNCSTISSSLLLPCSLSFVTLCRINVICNNFLVRSTLFSVLHWYCSPSFVICDLTIPVIRQHGNVAVYFLDNLSHCISVWWKSNSTTSISFAISELPCNNAESTFTAVLVKIWLPLAVEGPLTLFLTSCCWFAPSHPLRSWESTVQATHPSA